MATKKNIFIRIINGENHLEKKYYTYAHIREDEQLPFYIGIGTQNKKSGRFSRAKVVCDKSTLWKNKLKNKRYYIVICTSSDSYSEIKEHEKDVIFTNNPPSIIFPNSKITSFSCSLISL